MQPIHVLTNRYSNARLGTNLAETRLTVGNVNTKGFGKLFTRAVDGDLYAQPLVVSRLPIGGTTRNVVFLATTKNTVYAYDADDPEACMPLWSRNLGFPMPRNDVLRALGDLTGVYRNFGSEIGIVSTPAIDFDYVTGRGVLYVVAKTRVVSAAGAGVMKSYLQKIHALDIATGEPVLDPMEIRATGRRKDGTLITFDPLFQLNRPGLLLDRGVLYTAFGSHTDIGEFYGWIMAYDAKTLKQLAVYNTAPDWGEGGVWQSGCGLASDSDGYVYAVVGNGDNPEKYFESNLGNLVPDVTRAQSITEPAYGCCILKFRLHIDAAGTGELKVEDWYTTPDVMDLNSMDTDLISGPVLFEAPQDGQPPRKLVLGGGKDGRYYLLNRDDMGHWEPLSGGKPSYWGTPREDGGDGEMPMHHHHDAAPADAPPRSPPPAVQPPKWNVWKDGRRPENAVQDDQLCIYHIHGAPVVWRRASDSGITSYVWSEKDALRAFRFDDGKFVDDRSDGFALVMLKLTDVAQLPATAGRNTFFAADVAGKLHIRIVEDLGVEVDANGAHIPDFQACDENEAQIEGRDPDLASLKEQLNPFWPPAVPPTREQAERLITKIVSVVFPNRPDRTTSVYRFPQDEMRMPGGFLTLSADGDKDGTAIVWASYPTDDDAMNKVVKGTLCAYAAEDLTQLLWTSDQDSYGGDRVGSFAKYVSPVVANGKVYLATFSRELAVYGLFSDVGSTRIIFAAGMFEFRTYGPAGTCAASAGRYDLSAAGGAIKAKSTSDNFVFAYKFIDLEEESIVSITARLSGINASSPTQSEARAGIMIRKFSEDGDPVRIQHYAALLVKAGEAKKISDNHVVSLSRPAARRLSRAESNHGKHKLPVWLRLRCEKIARGRVLFRYQISKDGIDWAELRSGEMSMDGRVQVGLVAASQVDPKPATSSADPKPADPIKTQARFDNVDVFPVLT